MKKRPRPSKTPYTKSWPLPRERGTGHTTGFGGTPDKDYIRKPSRTTRLLLWLKGRL